MSRKKAKSGTWVTRIMMHSKAYWALNSTAKGLLILFLMKRDMSKQHECMNCKALTMTYLELENLYGPDPFGKPQGLARSSINRGLTDLRAKGFIEIIRQGGTYQKDKTIYGLCEHWKRWVPGQIIDQKTKGLRTGYRGNKNNLNVQSGTHTHPQNGTLKDDLGYQNATHNNNDEYAETAT